MQATFFPPHYTQGPNIQQAYAIIHSEEPDSRHATKPQKDSFLTVTTPALLFPAISLLLLAYTNRFLVLAQLIRQLKQMETEEDYPLIARQLGMLRQRIVLTKRMQATGVLSFFVCTVSMFALFLDWETFGLISFGGSLILLSLSLLFSLWETLISNNAINAELEDFERKHESKLK